MGWRFFIVFSFFVFPNAINSQIAKEKTLEIYQRDSVYVLNEFMAIYIDEEKNVAFDRIQGLTFDKTLKDVFGQNAFYWHKFKLLPKVTGQKLYLYDVGSEIAEVYIPIKKGYKKLYSGQLNPLVKPTKRSIMETSILEIPMGEIDFNKEFYVHKKSISYQGFQNANLGLEAMISNSIDIEKFSYVKSEEELPKRLKIYAGIFSISCLLFLIGFVVTGDKNFLFYCLYLLFTTTLVIPVIPYFFNFLNGLHPLSTLFFKKVSTIMASAVYFYFAIRVLQLKKLQPRTYQICRFLLMAIAAYAVCYIIILLVNPYNYTTIALYKWFRIIFGLGTLALLVYLLFTLRKNLVNSLVLIGISLLILGNLLSIFFNNFQFYLITVIIETLLFWAVTNYNHKINQQKKTEVQFELKTERRLKEKLEELDRAKSNFFANISHELRTPLTLIATPLQEKLAGNDISAKDRKSFQMMLRNNQQLAHLVDQLLDLSKLESGNRGLKIAKTPLTDFLNTIVEPFIYEAKTKQFTFRTLWDIQKDVVWIDRDALQKIVSNLLSNALKYTQAHGQIVVEARAGTKLLELTVSNTGKPLTGQQKEQLFNRFYQGDGSHQGVGIGLALAKELVQLHRGNIGVENIDKERIAFRVELPCDQESFESSEMVEKTDTHGVTHPHYLLEEALQDEEVLETDWDANVPLLLAVEDNKDLRDLLYSTFKDSYRVILAANGEEGINIAIAQLPDLILSDVMMPVKDGIALTQELKQHELTSHIPIILLTAKTGDDNELTGIDSGADDYISKPFNNALLKSKMANVLRNRQKMRERYSQEVVLKPQDIAIAPPDALLLARIQTVMDGNIREASFSTEDFAKKLGFSRMQLHRKLKALTGLSATEFIRSQRLKLAAKMLEQSEATVSEICYQTGFNNLSYFAKCFKEAYGVPPSQYPKKA